MLKEFKEFAMRGNVVDMAVGIVIGAAFGKIVSSFVSDVLMPPIGLLLGGVDFSNWFVDLSGQGFATLAAAKEAGAATLNYGVFVNTVIDFVIVAFAIFIVVKQMNRLKKTEEEAPAAARASEAGSPARRNPRPAQVRSIAARIRCAPVQAVAAAGGVTAGVPATAVTPTAFSGSTAAPGRRFLRTPGRPRAP